MHRDDFLVLKRDGREIVLKTDFEKPPVRVMRDGSLRVEPMDYFRSVAGLKAIFGASILAILLSISGCDWNREPKPIDQYYVMRIVEVNCPSKEECNALVRLVPLSEIAKQMENK